MDEKVDVQYCQSLIGHPEDWAEWQCKDAAAQLRALLAERERHLAECDRLDRITKDCGALLRRWCWQAKKTDGDNSFKVLAGQTDDYMRRVGIQGSPLRDEAAIAVAEGGQ